MCWGVLIAFKTVALLQLFSWRGLFFSHPHSGCWAITGNTFWKSWGEVIGWGPDAFGKNRRKYAEFMEERQADAA